MKQIKKGNIKIPKNYYKKNNVKVPKIALFWSNSYGKII